MQQIFNEKYSIFEPWVQEKMEMGLPWKKRPSSTTIDKKGFTISPEKSEEELNFAERSEMAGWAHNVIRST